MKNVIKKAKTSIIGILTSIVLLVAPIQPSIVAQAAEPQSRSSTVSYTVDDYFYINIPETIYVGTETKVSAIETNIAPGKTIYVRIEGVNTNGFITLQNDFDPSHTIQVYFKDSSGANITSENNLIAQFGKNDNGMVQSVSFYTETNASPSTDSAGSYSGQIYFDIICE